MTEQHPITPPPELVEQWNQEWLDATYLHGRDNYIATQAARWGADQQLKLDAEQINEAWQKGADAELEACCEVLCQKGVPAWSMLRLNRRPKPPSLKERALAVLDDVRAIDATHYNILRNALEQLDD